MSLENSDVDEYFTEPELQFSPYVNTNTSNTFSSNPTSTSFLSPTIISTNSLSSSYGMVDSFLERSLISVDEKEDEDESKVANEVKFWNEVHEIIQNEEEQKDEEEGEDDEEDENIINNEIDGISIESGIEEGDDEEVNLIQRLVHSFQFQTDSYDPEIKDLQIQELVAQNIELMETVSHLQSQLEELNQRLSSFEQRSNQMNLKLQNQISELKPSSNPSSTSNSNSNPKPITKWVKQNLILTMISKLKSLTSKTLMNLLTFIYLTWLHKIVSTLAFKYYIVLFTRFSFLQKISKKILELGK